MKPSHLQTPRSLSQGQFTHGYTSGPAYKRSHHVNDRIVMWGCAAAVVALVLLAWRGAL